MDKTQSELNRLLYDARHNTELREISFWQQEMPKTL